MFYTTHKEEERDKYIQTKFIKKNQSKQKCKKKIEIKITQFFLHNIVFWLELIVKLPFKWIFGYAVLFYSISFFFNYFSLFK